MTKKDLRIKKKQFVDKLGDAVAIGTGCSIQHTGWPCNTCFHHWAQNTLGLNSFLAHQLWLLILILRGDYSEEEIMMSVIDDAHELVRQMDEYKKIRKKNGSRPRK